MATTKVINDLIDLNQTGNTQALKGCVGTTANRPTSPSNGDIRTNTDFSSASSTSVMEFYRDTGVAITTGWCPLNNFTTLNQCNYPTTATALYQLDGNANDTCGNYNGTGSNVTYATGKFGQAGVFNGSNSKITFSNDFGALNNFSVSLWFNTASISVSQYFYYFSNYGVFIDTSGYINYYGNSNLQYTTAVSLNTWYNVVFVKSSTAGKKIYLNGVEVATDTDTGNLPASFPTYSRSLIGAGIYNASTDWRFFNGKIDQFRVFPSVLSATQVTDLYNE